MYISRSQPAPTSHDLMLQHCRQHDLLRFWSFAICFKLLHGCAGSISYNSWIPAEVLGWNSELHCYILNIQAVAAPHKVRFFLQIPQMVGMWRRWLSVTECLDLESYAKHPGEEGDGSLGHHISRSGGITESFSQLICCQTRRSVYWCAGLVFSQRSHVYTVYIYIWCPHVSQSQCFGLKLMRWLCCVASCFRSRSSKRWGRFGSEEIRF